MSSATILNLDPRDYPGGIAIWGAMPPVLDTTRRAPEAGVHVHARKQPGKKKEIDATYDSVNVNLVEGGKVNVVTVDGKIAQAFNVADILGLPMDALACPTCGCLHFDRGIAGLTPHTSHACDRCGSGFRSIQPVISNPLNLLKASLQTRLPKSGTVPSTRAWSHSMRDWSDGVQVWGSNEAIIWTAQRPEESGIHVHAFNRPTGLGVRLADETFGRVEIDGVVLDAHQVRILMAQLASECLRPYVASVSCPHCGNAHFADQTPATPSALHVCVKCGLGFETPQPTISNPAKQQMAYLRSVIGSDDGNS
jgi:predicted RNA-binding Zn-ribbon protein involved in translation (DUF1610 family)